MRWVSLRFMMVSILAIPLAPVFLVCAQKPLEQANQLFAAGKWLEASKAYEAILQTEPKNGRAWYRLGLAQHNLRQFPKAIQAFERAEAIGFAPASSRYNIATCFALEGDKKKALDSLSKAAKAGFAGLKTLETDEDLNSLRDHPRFKEIAKQVKRAALPCEFDPRYQEFDFWVGDWDVFTPAGRKAGTNSIQKIAGGCALLENWTSVTGGSGKSLNFYDASKRKWVQMWADSSGEIIPTEGEFKDGAMRLQGQLIQRDGKKTLYRGTWTPLPDGRVHQFLEESVDGGKTWNTWFDGFYQRRNSTGG
jgi:tetratricopeptide (TPR) repeat protein